jgi:hypothetical protein
MKVRTIRKDKINVVTLGCSKNLVDSENLITQLRGNDYEVTHERDDARGEYRHYQYLRVYRSGQTGKHRHHRGARRAEKGRPN